ncbi:MAG: N-methyl-L-tryptophan oxidase [Planctomycetia bacterium]
MHHDCIVIGLGGMGSAAAYHLAARGRRVLGLEQFTPAHARGSSHGHSRIIRKAYMEHPAYVPLLERAFTLWRELAEACTEDLLHLTGGVMIGRPDTSVIMGTLASIRAHGLPHEILDARALRARFPAFTAADGIVGIAEHAAGYVVPEAAVRTHLELAAACGAELRFSEPVRRWRGLPTGGVEVETQRGVFTADNLVVAPGPFAPTVLAGLGLPLSVERRVLLWCDPIGGVEPFRQPDFPVYIWDCDDGRAFYGFPAQPGTPGVKVALHTGHDPCTPESIDRSLRADDVAAVRELLATRIPALCGSVLHHETCMYTVMPDGHFVIAAHPEHPQVVVASPCSGHGFKFVPVVGEILADLVIDGRTAHDIALFTMRL